MKKNRILLLTIELILGILVFFLVRQIFADPEPQKKVAVVISDSGDAKWDSFIRGLKQAAKDSNIHLIICNTDEIEDCDEELQIIQDQIDNGVDAFLVMPVKGDKLAGELRTLNNSKPVILIVSDLVEEKTSELRHLSYVGPDNYKAGQMLAEKMLQDMKDDFTGKRIGIVAGAEGTDSNTQRENGFVETIKGKGAKVMWTINRTSGENMVDRVKKQKQVDCLVVLDTICLREIGEGCSNKDIDIETIYGIGSDLNAVSLLGEEKIDGLVTPDGFAMGYKAMKEMSRRVGNEKGNYEIDVFNTEMKVLNKEDIFSEENQKFLKSYQR